MMIRVLAILLLTTATAFALTQKLDDNPPPRTALPDQPVKDLIVEDSINAYPGTCPCPYTKDTDGSYCLGRSAYEATEGGRPLCYPDDVTPSMIEGYRAKHGIPKAE